MADFLEFIRRRRAQIRKELHDLEVAERVYLEANPDQAIMQESLQLFRSSGALSQFVAAEKAPKGIQQMVTRLLDEAHPGGLTALEILDQIQKRWKPNLMRTSLSPQLSRLKENTVVKNDKGKWYLVTNTGAPPEGSAPA